jgi:diguanylate cyclase (GGDEF)-like protein/PAS domain S-box-containing protein
VTERKRAEEALRRSEERFRSLVQNSSDIITILNEDGTVRYQSPAMEQILGYVPQERVGSHGLELIHPDDRERLKSVYAEVRDEPRFTRSVEVRCRHKDGSWRYLEAVVHNLLGDPSVRGLVVNARDVTERVRTEETLRESERRYATLLSNTPAMVYRCLNEPDWPEEYVSDYAEELTGYTTSKFMEDPTLFCRLITEEDKQRIWEEVQEAVGRGERFRLRYKIRHRDGGLRHVEELGQGVYDEEGSVVALEGLIYDVTERELTEERLRETEERYRSLVEQIPALIYVDTLDGVGSRGYTSPQAEAMLGYSLDEWTADTALWAKLLHSEDRERVVAERVRANANGEPLGLEYRMIAKDGRVVWLRDDSVILYDSAGRPQRRQGVMFDITERKALEGKLEQQVLHDSLTGLPNRVLFSDRLQHALDHAHRRNSEVAVMFMDLDNFKLVNDSLGHEVGDRLLVGVSERLKNCLRAEDTLARFGGDEFTVLLEEVEGELSATQVVERITQELQAPFFLEGHEFVVTASIGIAHSGPSSVSQAEDLLRWADLAMYSAKRKGKGRHEVFDQGMGNQVLERLKTETELRRALERREFVVHYQPFVGLETNKVVGFEALLRWEHPEQGVLEPTKFISIAEETGLIVPIGRWVLAEACRQTARWQGRFPGSPSLVLSVNLSAKQFQDPHLASYVAEILRQTGLDPHRLHLEITEDVIMDDASSTMSVLRELKALGVEITIDDFGTGYSSLSDLKRFPVNSLKVNHSFVGGLGKTREDTEIVSGITSLARALNLRVIAEGVENPLQLERLREIGCDAAQGYHFSKPLPGEAADTLLHGEGRIPGGSKKRVSFERLTDWVEGRLSEQEARAVEEQVSVGDSATLADVAWLRAFARISEDTVIASPPSRVRDALIERFEAYAEGKQHPGLLQRLVATLTFDSGQQPALGWRTTTPASQRQFAYSTEAADVTINVRPRRSDRLLRLDGHIFPVNSTYSGTFGVQLLAGSSEVATTATNDLGEFVFEAVSPGVYEIIVSSDRVEISIPQVDLRHVR